MRAQDAAAFMRAFGNGTRLRIIALLAKRDFGVAELARLIGCPAKRISRHLQYLQARGVVDPERDAKAVIYGLASPQNDLHRSVLDDVIAAAPEIEEVRQDASWLSKRKAIGRRRRSRGE